ncbi:MAG TPA: metallophosphoesterase [Candidatus Nanoarchaeia archaeon]|nr:metallophosphoesterase [Candidatus Nanoarchaeia archaeon]
MKILAIGDFHGNFPKSIKEIIKKEKIDFVLSNGDFFPFWYRKLWFKHCYAKNVNLWEVIGKNKYKNFILKDLKMGEKAIKALNELPVPVYTVVGNLDYARLNDSLDLDEYYEEHGGKIAHWDWGEQDFFSKIIKKYKNIRRIDYKSARFGNFVLIGAYGGTNPGEPESETFKKYQKKLANIFLKNRGKKIIFVSHNVPNNTKLDKIGKHAHKLVRGKHYGSILVKKAIIKFKPLVHIGGHIHEGRGTQKVGKTVCVNPGAVHEGQGSIVEIVEDKVKVRMIKV